MANMEVNSLQWQALLREQAAICNYRLDHTAINQLGRFAEELILWNKKINLTAITDPLEVLEKHFIDSLIPGNYIPANAFVLDMGTGGGFPGMPLKIGMPSLNLCLADSARKKINFLKYMISTLKISNIRAHQCRVETLADDPDFFGQFDVVICRAFTALKNFLAPAAPLIKAGGRIIAMKGKDVQAEVDALLPDHAGASGLAIEKYRLPISGDERSLIIVKKSFFLQS